MDLQVSVLNLEAMAMPFTVEVQLKRWQQTTYAGTCRGMAAK